MVYDKISFRGDVEGGAPRRGGRYPAGPAVGAFFNRRVGRCPDGPARGRADIPSTNVVKTLRSMVTQTLVTPSVTPLRRSAEDRRPLAWAARSCGVEAEGACITCAHRDAGDELSAWAQSAASAKICATTRGHPRAMVFAWHRRVRRVTLSLRAWHRAS